MILFGLTILGLINESSEQVPADHRDLFTDLFLSDAKDDRFAGHLSGVDTRKFFMVMRQIFLFPKVSIYAFTV